MRLNLESDGDIVSLVRNADADSIVVVAHPSADAIWTAFARAAIGPLAIERAPGCRVNAVFAGEGALPADIDAAADFLDRARSTTGQIVDVRPQAPA
ncbi:Rossmann fold domain-containing protein [Sphingomonas sp. M1A8_2b]